MSYQIQCHNEVTLIGRIYNIRRNIKCNNNSAILVQLLLPNDEDYNLEPNRAYVYFYNNDKNFMRGMKGQAIAVSAHIESKYGQKIIADCFTFLKEKMS